MAGTVPADSPKHSSNPIVRTVAHNTATKQPDTIPTQRIKLHANSGSINVESVDGLLSDAVADGELEETADGYRVSE